MLQLLHWTESYLADHDISGAKNEAEILLSDFLRCSKVDLYLESLAIDKEEEKNYRRLVEKRGRKVPLQILLGNTRFVDWSFLVRKGVFIPRAETEVLVETACQIIRQFLSDSYSRILDLGTGSGNIAICLAKIFPKSRVFATDRSSRALCLARKNAGILGEKDKISFRCGDLFSALRDEDCLEKFSLIVSNPPYIPEDMLSGLPVEVKNFDPVMSLDGGKDGLIFYRKILSGARRYLKRRGFIVMEIGERQAEVLRELVGASKDFEFLRVLKDNNGLDRVVVIRSN